MRPHLLQRVSSSSSSTTDLTTSTTTSHTTTAALCQYQPLLYLRFYFWR